MSRTKLLDEDDYDDEDDLFWNSEQNPLLSSNGSISSYHEPVPLTASLFHRNVKLAQVCVMISVVLERAAYYSLLGNLAYFVNGHLKYSNENSFELVLGFSGMTWLSCFIGGLLGDIFLGRFKTILTGLILYVIGFANLPILEYVLSNSKGSSKEPGCIAWLIISLLILSLGEGCFKSNMSPFGADQLEKAADNEYRTFFNYFYWAINIGGLIGYSLLTWIQQKYGFIIGYAIPAGLLMLTLLIFCIPRMSNYHVVTPAHNILMKVLKVCCNAKKRQGRSSNNEYESFNPIQHWLDRSKVKYGGKYADADVEEVKTVLAILPVFGFLIIYCACYFQTPGTFLIQGLHMSLMKFSRNEPVPASWFSLFNVIIVLIFVPIINRYIYPLLERCRENSPFLLRMSIGMILASLSMVTAGIIETHRLKTNHTIINYVDVSVNVTAKDMTVLYQIPQYALMGISEIFVLITGLEFAYCQSPKSMQSFVTSMFFIANGLGSFLGALLIFLGNTFGLNITAELPPKKKHFYIPPLTGNLNYFFYFLAALNFLNTTCFVAYAIFKVRRRKKRDLEYTVAAYIQNSMETGVRNNQRSF